MDYNDEYITIKKDKYDALLLNRVELYNLKMSVPKFYVNIFFTRTGYVFNCNDVNLPEKVKEVCNYELKILNNTVEKLQELHNKLPWWKKIF
jgi:hypothetical protein